MRSTLAVETAASDLTLLSIEEMREAAGVAGTANDAKLQALEARMSAAIMAECQISVAGGHPPTLRRETLLETFRAVYDAPSLVLSRRHDVEISAVVVDGRVLDAAEYEVDAEAGMLFRICGDHPLTWCARKIEVTYEAGFETVPGDLKAAAFEVLRSAWLASGRDPLVKSERVSIPDVNETERQYWVGAVPGQSTSGAVPDAISGKLVRYRNGGYA